MITVVIGEGGSGGASALAWPTGVLMLENAASLRALPEGFASIPLEGTPAARRSGRRDQEAHRRRPPWAGAADEVIPELWAAPSSGSRRGTTARVGPGHPVPIWAPAVKLRLLPTAIRNSREMGLNARKEAAYE